MIISVLRANEKVPTDCATGSLINQFASLSLSTVSSVVGQVAIKALFDIIRRATSVHSYADDKFCDFVVTSERLVRARPRDRLPRNKLFARARVAHPRLPRNE